MSYIDDVGRGHVAQREWVELEDAFDRVRQAILTTLADTSPSHPDTILKLHMAAQNLVAVRQVMRAVIDHGLLAEHALQQAGLSQAH